MSELRFNQITGDWVIIGGDDTLSPESFVSPRGAPHDFLQARVPKDFDPYMPPAHVIDCPFCVGNESRCETLAATPRNGSWGVRLVRNNFALLSPTEEKRRGGAGMRCTMSGVGYQEVVVEHPEHNRWLWHQSHHEAADVIEMLRRRYAELGSDPRIELVVPFKNHGAAAGTSLLHPHTQIVGSPIMAADVRRRLGDAIRYYDEHARCLFCDVIGDECEDGERIIHSTERFVSFIPYAALSPFHLLLFPKKHQADFGAISEADVADLARHLQVVLKRIDSRLAGPDFNFVIRSVFADRTAPRVYHWYMSIVPHVAGGSGFAMGSGMFINPTLPEASARFLRGDEGLRMVSGL